MTAVSTTDTERTETASDGEGESTDSAGQAVSWGTAGPNWLQSLGVGGLLGVAMVALPRAFARLPAIVGSLSVDLVGSVGVLLLVCGPLALRAWQWADETLDRDPRPLRPQLEWSSVRPLWAGIGAILGGATIWAVDDVLAGVYTIQMIAVFLSMVFQYNRQTTTTVDPAAGVIETERHDRTKRRSLDWAVDIRRFDLFSRSLFVVSNRGKRWYEGPHLLSVPRDLAHAVDPMLRRMVTEGDAPPRIGRDERLIIGAVGASMLGIGPLLYLLSGEGALLLIIVGPSALVAHFALLHAHRG